MILNLYAECGINDPELYSESLIMTEYFHELNRVSDASNVLYAEAIGFMGVLKIGLKFLISFITSFQGVIISIIMGVISILIKRKLGKTLEVNYGGGGGGGGSSSSSNVVQTNATIQGSDEDKEKAGALIDLKTSIVAREIANTLQIPYQNPDVLKDPEKVEKYEKAFQKGLAAMGIKEEDLMNAILNQGVEDLKQSLGTKELITRYGIVEENPSSFYTNSIVAFNDVSNFVLSMSNEKYKKVANDQTIKALSAFGYERANRKLAAILNMEAREDLLIDFIGDVLKNANELISISLTILLYAPLSAIQDETFRKEIEDSVNSILLATTTDKNIKAWKSKLNEKLKEKGKVKNADFIKTAFASLMAGTRCEFKITSTERLTDIHDQIFKPLVSSVSHNSSKDHMFKTGSPSEAKMGIGAYTDPTDGFVYTYFDEKDKADFARGKLIACKIIAKLKDDNFFEQSVINSIKDKAMKTRRITDNILKEVSSQSNVSDADASMVTMATDIIKKLQTIIVNSCIFLSSAKAVVSNEAEKSAINDALSLVQGMSNVEIKE